MANVLNRTTKQFLTSVNTPDFPLVDWIHNPDLSSVTGFASKYWEISGDSVGLMDQAERDALDASEASALLDAARAEAKREYDTVIEGAHKLIKAVALVALDQINVLRGDLSRPAITVAQMKTAIENKVDTL